MLLPKKNLDTFDIFSKKNSFKKILCAAMGSELQFFELAGALWTLMVGVTFYFIVDKENAFRAQKYEVLFNLVSWGIPAITLVVSNVLKLYADVGLWFVELQFFKY